MGLLARLKQSAKAIKREIVVVYFAARDKRTPWWLRIFALLIAAYVLSPIDLIPDFIPVLGYLDDVILVPLAIRLLMRLLPPQVVADARDRASKLAQWPRSLVAASVVVILWMGLATWLVAQVI
jgi:uncharacterized membrane protein YkvA (DUF1232 family)